MTGLFNRAPCFIPARKANIDLATSTEKLKERTTQSLNIAKLHNTACIIQQKIEIVYEDIT